MPVFLKLLLLPLLAFALADAAGAGTERASSVRFTFVPVRAFQGQPISVSVAVRPAGTRCTLTVRYANGATQPGLTKARAVNGRAGWHWKLPASAATGTARVVVSCGRAGRVTRTVSIVGNPDAAPKVVLVEKGGFSQRLSRFGNGSNVSYGLLLRNPSRGYEAREISVVVNFVDANGHVLGSDTESIDAIEAGGVYALGGSASLRVTTPVARLEVTGQFRGRAPAERVFPSVQNVRPVADRFDPQWTGAVEGELVNEHKTMFLTRARVSVVLFDAAGNIVGGASGFMSAPLMPGTRVFFSASQGIDAVPFERVAAAQVSTEPTYEPRG